MSSLIKSKLIESLTNKNPHLYTRDLERVVSTVFNEITKSLAEGRRVELRGFGAFSIQRRAPRVGRNPRTGEAVQVSDKYIPRFKPGRELKIKLNEKQSSSESKEEDN